MGVVLPDFDQARCEPAECVELTPTEYRADAVVVLSEDTDAVGSGALEVLVEALDGVETEQALLYVQLVLAALPDVARAHLEGLMTARTFEYQSEFTERLRGEGRVEGRVEAKVDGVLRVLRARGVAVPDEVRARIAGCTDLDQLDVWLERAVTADTIADLDG